MLTSFTKYNKNYVPDENNKVSLFIKLQQWAQGTSIAVLNNIPAKLVVTELTGVTVTMPTEHLTYTVEDKNIKEAANIIYSCMKNEGILHVFATGQLKSIVRSSV